MNGILVKPKRDIKVIEFNDSLDEYYKLLDCSCIDIVERKIGNHVIDIVCDDEALLKEEPTPSMCDCSGKVMLFNAFLICSHDSNGNEIGLSDLEIHDILMHKAILASNKGFTHIITGGQYVIYE